jgi:hypothetical protein
MEPAGQRVGAATLTALVDRFLRPFGLAHAGPPSFASDLEFRVWSPTKKDSAVDLVPPP